MLVIKMLKKASNMNNIELAEYLGKSRNTIASWELDENNIPNTEKIKLSNRFEFNYEYWNIGLDKTMFFYKKMYSDIKTGYIKDSQKYETQNASRIDEILKNCDSSVETFDSYLSYDNDNEYNHFKYIQSLLDGIDPIDNTPLSKDHFINEYRANFKFMDSLSILFYDNNNNNQTCDVEDYNFEKLKNWRKEQANIEKVKPFQILSDEVLKNIALQYSMGNVILEGIKNFPCYGIKWNKYYESIEKILKEG